MTTKFNVDGNANAAVKSIIHYDEVEKKLHVENTQDVEKVLEQNVKDQNNQNFRLNGFEDMKMRRLASIPMIEFERLAKMGIMCYSGKVLDRARLFKYLDDSNNQKLRIWKGRLS